MALTSGLSHSKMVGWGWGEAGTLSFPEHTHCLVCPIKGEVCTEADPHCLKDQTQGMFTSGDTISASVMLDVPRRQVPAPCHHCLGFLSSHTGPMVETRGFSGASHLPCRVHSLCGSKLVILPAPKGTVPGSYCWWPVLRAAILQWLYHPEHSWFHLITATPQLVVVLPLLPMLPRPPPLAATATWKDKVLNVPIRPPSKRPSPGSKKKSQLILKKKSVRITWTSNSTSRYFPNNQKRGHKERLTYLCSSTSIPIAKTECRPARSNTVIYRMNLKGIMLSE